MKKGSIWTPLTLALMLVIGIWLGVKLQNRKIASMFPQKFTTTNKMDVVLNLIEGNYVDSVSTNKIIEETIPEMLKQLDPHSTYIPARDMVAVEEEMQGNFSGIGVQFSIQKDTVMVIDVISGGPSQKIGILPGDRIIRVDDSTLVGKSVKNELVFKKLRGPRGSVVKVEVSRKGMREPIPFRITRGEIPIYSVDVSYMIDSRTGYVKIGRFAETTYTEFLQAMAKLKSAGATQFLIDLRGNPGGYLNVASKMVNELLSKQSMIVYTEGRSHDKQEYYATEDGRFLKERVVVLVDEFSASASEIFAGALQDNDRGTIIGRRTYGKGLVQEQIPFNDGSALRLTVARYYTPSGRCIQKPYVNGESEDYYEDIQKRFRHGEFEQKDSIHFADSIKYYTRNKRVVYGGGGIMPDIFIPADTTGNSIYLMRMMQKNVVYEFAFNYSDRNRDEFSKMKSGDEVIAELKKRGAFQEMIRYAESRGVATDPAGLKLSGKVLETQMAAYIARNTIGDVGFYQVISGIDNTLLEAIRHIQSGDQLVQPYVPAGRDDEEAQSEKDLS